MAPNLIAVHRDCVEESVDLEQLHERDVSQLVDELAYVEPVQRPSDSRELVLLAANRLLQSRHIGGRVPRANPVEVTGLTAQGS
jgi:hypothetical protein